MKHPGSKTTCSRRLRKETSMRGIGARQSGFSLIELMIAMVVTLIVTGAVFGLLSAGQSAFKVQPERTDRQQNIRTAMDIIMRDISAAGVQMPAFIQVFTPGLDGFVGGIPGATGAPTDELEIVTNPEGFANEEVCSTGAVNSDDLQLKSAVSPLTLPAGGGTRGILIFTGPTEPRQWAAVQVTNIADAPVPVDPAACATPAMLGAAPTGNRPKLSIAGCTGSGYGNIAANPCAVREVSFGEVVRYRIRLAPDQIPDLQRSTTANPNAGACLAGEVPPCFQVVARGIDDMQIQYVQAGPGVACTPAAPCPNAPAIAVPGPAPTAAEAATIITQVRVLLSSRSALQGIQGSSTTAGVSAIRGQLVASGSPRSALFGVNGYSFQSWR
jgi:prepilin-type N-terminal cleavage/methylation domain-containing protein